MTERTKKRAPAGSTGEGEFFHIEVRPKSGFVTFRTHDVGQPGGVERVAGQRANGTWADQAWLISKEDAHVDGDQLVPDSEGAREVIESLGSTPVHVKGDIFKAKPRRDVPESEKPTPAMQKSHRANIKKAQEAQDKEKWDARS